MSSDRTTPVPPTTIGRLAHLACTWEVLARKAGNVCPGREFPDLTVNDFLKSAAAIAPVLEQAPSQSLGVTILRCIEETRKVVQTNTNLGIVLLLAPLATVPRETPLEQGVARVLAQTTVEDARNVYAAIRLARPGGLGEVSEQDVRGEPTLPLCDVMALAQDRDLIARQYATDFKLVRGLGVCLAELARQEQNVEKAILKAQLHLLWRFGDDLIRRKRAGAPDDLAKSRILHILHSLDTREGRHALIEFDAFLRADNHARNPGTTADLIAAGLFVALREGRIALTAPFTWDEHPFQDGMPA